MKLYLSSQHLGNCPEKLLELVGENKKVVIISNAIDYYSEKDRKNRVKKEIKMLENIGLEPSELDLRNYFGKGYELKEYLKTKSLIWVRGGNIYILRRAMEACEFDKYVLPLILNNQIVYGGYSAAVISACKDLLLSEMIDNPNIIPEGYPKGKLPTSGLNLLDFYLVPHYDSQEEWAKNIKLYVDKLRKMNKKVTTFCDGEVFFCNGLKGDIINMNKDRLERKEKIEKLKMISKYVRTTALESILKADNGHIGGNLSSVELLTALYFGGQFNFSLTDSKNENRDRVLIRGHEGPLRYTIFSLLGYLNPKELDNYRKLGSRLPGHEDMFLTPGVDITPSGSLGMLLSYGVGACIANKEKGIDSRCVVFLGDGEEQEGNIGEAARHAANLNLDNLICILDKNGKQLSGNTKRTDQNANLKKIWEGYGFDVIEIKNGNNIEEVLNVYDKLKEIKRPTMIIANTIKGFGVEGAKEHFSGYHTLSAASNKKIVLDSYKKLREELVNGNLTYEQVSSIAQQMVKIPTNDTKTIDYVDSNVYNIRTTKSGLNLEQAQEDYLMSVKKRILESKNKSNLYMVTPDLLKENIVEKLEFKDFSHYIDTGIREQHAISMCHGISVENKEARIYVYTCDAFAFRGIDQINAAAQGKSNILIVGENSGIFQGQNGKTHQSISQPGALLSIPEVKFYEPADSVDLYNVFSDSLVKNDGLSYVRLHRGNVNIERNNSDINNTGAYFIHQTDKEPKLVIISSGFMAENAVLAAKELESSYGIPVNVINVVNIKMFFKYAQKLLQNNAPIITLYNGNPNILSQVVANTILENESIPRPKFIYGHGFIEGRTGKVDDLIKYYNFDTEGIKKLCLKKMK